MKKFKTLLPLIFILAFLPLLFASVDTDSSADSSQVAEEAAAKTADSQVTADETQAQAPTANPEKKPESWENKTNELFGKINKPFEMVLFNPNTALPPIVWWLVIGGIFFTFRYGFVNIKLFKHSFQVIRGKYDNPADEGEISHFQALTSALSATVGLGNIAGVAVAIAKGGPGAVFWLWATAFFGMSMKFSCCTLAQKYRKLDENGKVLGGPMMYLKEGLAKHGYVGLGKFLAILFAFLTICGSLGGGNMFQANQTFELISGQFPFMADYDVIVGLILAFLVGVVIVGGIRRIGDVTSKLVPAMCLFYFACCFAIVLLNVGEVPHMLGTIFKSALSPDAMYGGFLGVVIQGVTRASFSNEAGMGSAAIAHSAAKTKEPIREGVVGLLEPFIDTHVVCTMTSLAILITGAHLDPELAGKGAQITAKAFSSLGTFFPIMLTIAACIFAYSTAISWSYYGERATVYLFGPKGVMPYRIFFVLIVVLGPLLSLGNVIGFSDITLLSMSIPNLIGMYILSGEVRKDLDKYKSDLNSGKMPVFK